MWGGGATFSSPAVYRGTNSRELKLTKSWVFCPPLFPCLVLPTRCFVRLEHHFFSPIFLSFIPHGLFLPPYSQVIACGVPVGFPVGPVVELVRQESRVTIHGIGCLLFRGILLLSCRLEAALD